MSVLNESVLSEFGERLGIRHLQFSNENQVDLEIAESDHLQIQLMDEALLMCYAVSSQHQRVDVAFMERLLNLTHPDNDNLYAVQVGFVGDDHIVFVIRLVASEASADEMMAVFDFLWELRQTYVSA
ncbi:MAG: CesT family type III secretion system chaperone [Gammaproteobacteria bacterium]